MVDENAGESVYLAIPLLMTDVLLAGVIHKRNTSVGRRYGVFVLFIISMMCIIREAYLCATAGNVVKVRAVWLLLVYRSIQAHI